MLLNLWALRSALLCSALLAHNVLLLVAKQQDRERPLATVQIRGTAAQPLWLLRRPRQWSDLRHQLGMREAGPHPRPS